MVISLQLLGKTEQWKPQCTTTTVISIVFSEIHVPSNHTLEEYRCKTQLDEVHFMILYLSFSLLISVNLLTSEEHSVI